jgi:hypothetical protein
VNSLAKAGSAVRWAACENGCDESVVTEDPHNSIGKTSWPHWQRHEIVLGLLGGLATAALAIVAGPTHPATGYVLLATTLVAFSFCVAGRHAAVGWQKARLLAACIFVFWFYFAIEIIVPALNRPTYDLALLRIDEQIFGQTPAVSLQEWSSPWFNEAMSGCYLCYLVYLYVCLGHAFLMPLPRTRHFVDWLTCVYAAGLVGYLLIPATGPLRAFPELFDTALEGPLLTPLNQSIVSNGSSVYDAFPSLHVLITCTLLEFDRQYCRWRFYLMLLPTVGIFTSAIYLRYHFAIDLLAGGALYVAAWLCYIQVTTANENNGEGKDVCVEAGNVK